MNGKKGRRNGDNRRDHSSYEPSKTSCAVRNPYLCHPHLPDSVSGYRKRLVKKGIRTPLSSISHEYPFTLYDVPGYGLSSALTKMCSLFPVGFLL